MERKKNRYDKAFCWYHLENGAWTKGKDSEQPPLYKQGNIEWARQHGKTLYIAEGEKDVDTLTQKLHLPAVCSPHGAGQGRLENKWRADYNALFAGADVAILADNDEAGKALANHIAAQLLPVAKSVKLPDLAFEWQDLKPKGDITDIYEAQTPLPNKTIAETVKLKLEALTTTTEALTAESLAAVPNKEPNPGEQPTGAPVWITDGKLKEADYITAFVKKHGVKCINNRLYSVDGSLSDGKAKQIIINDILHCVKANHGDKAERLLRGVKSLCFMEPPKPDTDRLHFQNGTLYKDKNGLFTVFKEKKHFCLNRLPVRYEPNAPQPERFFRYLNEVFNTDDQVTLQEYCGYCLLPTTVLQKMLVIIGSGGEGKSVLGAVLNGILGEENCLNESINALQSRFGVANLENKLLFLDDDLSENALHSSRNLKTLVTNKGRISAERKGVQENQIKPFVRFLCFGNFPIQALYDTSEGFMRRQLIMEAKPKNPNRVDNPSLSQELLDSETEGITQWLINGLNRLIQNSFTITISDRTQAVSDQIKRENDTVMLFLEECSDIVIQQGLTVFSECLYTLYNHFCEENLLPPLTAKSFVGAVKSKGKSKGIRYSTNVSINGRRARGFEGIGNKK